MGHQHHGIVAYWHKKWWKYHQFAIAIKFPAPLSGLGQKFANDRMFAGNDFFIAQMSMFIALSKHQ